MTRLASHEAVWLSHKVKPYPSVQTSVPTSHYGVHLQIARCDENYCSTVQMTMASEVEVNPIVLEDAPSCKNQPEMCMYVFFISPTVYSKSCENICALYTQQLQLSAEL